MTWNYRLLRTYHGRPDGTTEELLAVHEVFYNDEGQVDAWSERPVWPCGEILVLASHLLSIVDARRGRSASGQHTA